MMIRSKVTPPPPVPPRPSKTIVAEALAKSRKLSPVRALYATQPLSVVDLQTQSNGIPNLKNTAAIQKYGTPHIKEAVEIRKNGTTPLTVPKPVVPVRTAPPPPIIKPKPNGQIGQPQVLKSYSSAMVFNPKLRQTEDSRVIRSVSDVSDEITCNKSRTIIYQSSNLKTSKIEINLARKSSIKNDLNRVENTNERNKLNDKQPINPTPANTINGDNNRHYVTINTAPSPIIESSIKPKLIEEHHHHHQDIENLKKEQTGEANKVVKNDTNEINPIDKVIDVIINDKASKLSETIVQSSDKTTIIVTNTGKTDDANNNIFDRKYDETSEKDIDTTESSNKKVQFDDKVNHEILIAELQSMKEEQERFLKRQRKAPVDIYDCDNDSVNSDITRIQHSDWIEVANNGEEVRLSSCQIHIDNSDESSKSSSFSSSSSRKAQRAPSMSSLHGLPPLPKSLSGFNLLDNTSSHRVETPRGSYRVSASPGPQTPSRAGSSRGTTPPTPGSGSGHVVYPPHPRVNGTSEIPRGRKITTLDTQLAVLRREMYGLRQLDLSLLSQLYSLNEAIQDFRQMLQDQEDSALSPNSPSPSPSSGDEGDEFYSPAPLRYKPAPPAPPLRRTSNSSSANSSEYGTV